MPDHELLTTALTDDHQFELLCCDIMDQNFSDSSHHLPYPNSIPCYCLYGRNGQNQKGIDIISRYPIDSYGYYVAQCKNYFRQTDGKKLAQQLKNDIASINNSGIQISHIFIFTSSRRDVSLQDVERELNVSDPKVTIFFWEDISEYILHDPVLCVKWCNKISSPDAKHVAARCPKCSRNMILNPRSKQFECDYCNFSGKINVFVSFSSTINNRQSKFCELIERHLEAYGMDPITLGRNIYDMECPARGIKTWMERCYGLLTLGFKRTQLTTGVKYKKLSDKNLQDNTVEEELVNEWETSPFCQIEPAMAYSLDIPIIMFREKGVRKDGMFDGGIVGQYMPEIDLEEGPSEYFNSKECQQTLQLWIDRVISTWNIRNQL